MSVAFDASTDLGTATTGALTGTHTPSGTPRAAVAYVAHSTNGSLVTGATYGGVAMTLVGDVTDPTTETGRVYMFLLGSSVPTGAQTVTITHTGTAQTKWASVSTFTAAEDVVIAGSWNHANNIANPQAVMYTPGEALRTGIVWSALNAPANLTPLSGITTTHTVDFTNESALAGYETTASSGQFTFGWTATADDLAISVVALAEESTIPTGLDVTGVHVWTFISTAPDVLIPGHADTEALVVFIGDGLSGSSTDWFDSATYGGDALNEFATAADTATEPSRVYGLYLATATGGPQTFSTTMNTAITTAPRIVVICTIGTTIGLADSDTDSENQANPTGTLDSVGDNAIRFGWIESGLGAPANLTPSNLPTGLWEAAYALAATGSLRLDADLTPTSGSINVGWTAATDDVAAVYGAFIEEAQPILDEYNLASETDTSQAFSATVHILDEFGEASETDTSMPFEATAGALPVEDLFVEAEEGDTAQPFEAGNAVVNTFGIGEETDSARPFTAEVPEITPFGFAQDDEWAAPFTATAANPPVVDAFGLAQESDTARPFSANAPQDTDETDPDPGTPGVAPTFLWIGEPSFNCHDWQVWVANRFGVPDHPLENVISINAAPLRIIDQMSKVVIELEAEDSSVLDGLRPWGHEIQLYYGGVLQWAGPIQVSSYTHSTEPVVRVEAADLLAWTQVRILEGEVAEGLISAQFARIIELAMEPDDIGLKPNRAFSSVEGPLRITDVATAFSELTDLANLIDFTMHQRTLIVGAEEIPFPELGNIILPAHCTQYTVIRNGAEEATQVFFRGGDDFEAEERSHVVGQYPQEAIPDSEIGVVQRRETDSSILSVDLAVANAYSQQRVRRPPMWAVEDIELDLTRVPFRLEDIVAGGSITVFAPDEFFRNGRLMRVASVGLSVSREGTSVTLDIQPPGLSDGQLALVQVPLS